MPPLPILCCGVIQHDIEGYTSFHPAGRPPYSSRTNKEYLYELGLLAQASGRPHKPYTGNLPYGVILVRNDEDGIPTRKYYSSASNDPNYQEREINPFYKLSRGNIDELLRKNFLKIYDKAPVIMTCAQHNQIYELHWWELMDRMGSENGPEFIRAKFVGEHGGQSTANAQSLALINNPPTLRLGVQGLQENHPISPVQGLTLSKLSLIHSPQLSVGKALKRVAENVVDKEADTLSKDGDQETTDILISVHGMEAFGKPMNYGMDAWKGKERKKEKSSGRKVRLKNQELIQTVGRASTTPASAAQSKRFRSLNFNMDNSFPWSSASLASRLESVQSSSMIPTSATQSNPHQLGFEMQNSYTSTSQISRSSGQQASSMASTSAVRPSILCCKSITKKQPNLSDTPADFAFIHLINASGTWVEPNNPESELTQWWHRHGVIKAVEFRGQQEGSTRYYARGNDSRDLGFFELAEPDFDRVTGAGELVKTGKQTSAHCGNNQRHTGLRFDLEFYDWKDRVQDQQRTSSVARSLASGELGTFSGRRPDTFGRVGFREPSTPPVAPHAPRAPRVPRTPSPARDPLGSHGAGPARAPFAPRAPSPARAASASHGAGLARVPSAPRAPRAPSDSRDGGPARAPFAPRAPSPPPSPPRGPSAPRAPSARAQTGAPPAPPAPRPAGSRQPPATFKPQKCRYCDAPTVSHNRCVSGKRRCPKHGYCMDDSFFSNPEGNCDGCVQSIANRKAGQSSNTKKDSSGKKDSGKKKGSDK